MSDIEIDIDEIKRRMDGSLSALKGEFSGLRTGRASGSILDGIEVNAYGSMMPINQCGTVNVPEPRMLTVSVWDKGMVSAVEKAIRDSNLGINPVVDGTTLRLPMPDLNEERRAQLAKVAAQFGEAARVAVRNVRKDGMDQIKKAKSDGMGEDEQKIWSDEIQTLTNDAIKDIEGAVEVKQAEIMQV